MLFIRKMIVTFDPESIRSSQVRSLTLMVQMDDEPTSPLGSLESVFGTSIVFTLAMSLPGLF